MKRNNAGWSNAVARRKMVDGIDPEHQRLRVVKSHGCLQHLARLDCETGGSHGQRNTISSFSWWIQ